MQLRGFASFLRKHNVQIAQGDEYNLSEVLLQIGTLIPRVAEIRGEVNSIINGLPQESEEWGGCPQCGSNVHAKLSECPICGHDFLAGDEIDDEEALEDDTLEEDDQEEELTDADFEDVVPDYSEDDLDEVLKDEDPEEVNRSLKEFIEHNEGQKPSKEPELTVDDIAKMPGETTGPARSLAKPQNRKNYAETTIDDSLLEEELPEGATTAPKRKTFKRTVEAPKPVKPRSKPKLADKIPPRKRMTSADRATEKAKRRERLKGLLHKFFADPGLATKLKYADLLMMPHLLGYEGKPTSLGGKPKIQEWVVKRLKDQQLASQGR